MKQRSWSRFGRTAALVVVAVCGAGVTGCSSKTGPNRPAGVNMNGELNSQSICIGRFAFSIPEGSRITGRSQSIYRVDVTTVPVPAGGLDSLWHKRLVEIRGTAPPPDENDRIIRTYALARATKAVMYYDSTDSPGPRRLDGMRQTDNWAVIASRFGAQGQDRDMETLVLHVLDGYSPIGKEGFCVEHGVITSEPGNNEAAGARLDNPLLQDFEVVFRTQTVRDPKPIEELSDVDEFRRAFGGISASTQVLTSTTRNAAGLAGLEERIAVLPNGDPPFIRFSWKYSGEPLRSDHPQISIRAVCHSIHQAQMVEAWEAILGSLRQVPMSAKGWQ
jgi:Tle cognate immunity protein 4 C-terminal domain